MVGYYGQGVSDVENSHVKKYNVSGPQKSGLRISKLVCFLLIMGAILLAVLSALAVYFFAPHECIADEPAAAYTKAKEIQLPSIPRSKLLKVGQTIKDHFARNVLVPLKLLPNNTIPTHYKLRLMPFLIEGNFTTLGNVTINLDCVADTDKILLHAVDITIDRPSIRIKYINGDYFYRITDLTYNKDDQMYTFHLDRSMKAGELYFLHMSFVSKLNDLNQGFYRSSYIDKETNAPRWIASSQFSAIDARRAFPCFDEPLYKATFEISLARPNYMTTLSNMPRINSEDSMEMPGYSWDNFETTPKMSTYLVAFLVSDLQPYEFNTDGREFKIWSRKEIISDAIYASQITPRILKFYERYFDIKYPLPKLDQVAVPDFGFSAMENWGLINYRESVLLIDEQRSDISAKTKGVAVMAHELSHQWFGNLVTPMFWNDLFLKDGLANFIMYKGVHHVEPSWNFTNEILIEEQLNAMSVDIYSFSRPLSSTIESNEAIYEVFNTISYSKGASIMYMLQNIYGEENFRDTIKHFLNKHKYSNAAYSDFVQAFIEKNSKIPGLNNNNDLLTILDSWIKYAGYPVVNIVADYQNNSLTLTQKRFRYTSLDDKQDYNKLWWIPVSYVTKTQPDFEHTSPKFWIEGVPEKKVNLDIQEGYMLNVKHTGYYIVNYDEDNWKQITKNFIKFPLLVRAQVLANAMDLARANMIDYDIPFKMLMTVGRLDNHVLTISVAFQKLTYLRDMLVNTEGFSWFNNFLNLAFDQSFANTLPEESNTDTYEMKRLRKEILNWACMNSESRCVAKARALFRSLMIYKTPIQANVQELVYCTAIREGGETEFDFAYQMYLNATKPTEKKSILRSLGCSEQPWLLKKFLDMMLDEKSGVRKQDGQFVFTAVANNMRGADLAFTFMRDNWDKLKAYYGLGFNTLSNMVDSLSKYMNTPYDLEQLVSFGNKEKLESAMGAFQRAYENVQLNVEWSKRCLESVMKWLSTHSEHFGY